MGSFLEEHSYLNKTVKSFSPIVAQKILQNYGNYQKFLTMAAMLWYQLCCGISYAMAVAMPKVSKSQKHFFLKLHCPKVVNSAILRFTDLHVISRFQSRLEKKLLRTY